MSWSVLVTQKNTSISRGVAFLLPGASKEAKNIKAFIMNSVLVFQVLPLSGFTCPYVF